MTRGDALGMLVLFCGVPLTWTACWAIVRIVEAKWPKGEEG